MLIPSLKLVLSLFTPTLLHPTLSQAPLEASGWESVEVAELMQVDAWLPGAIVESSAKCSVLRLRPTGPRALTFATSP